ncbi:plasmid mobilization relaxosome protein MobC [Hymenobacter setariae]|uniref:Plasmid mobilization relaxosome protein MobC n=1 Tax=Hymenobacter setariae TaxID=2594794 RepID=A0A558BJV4_9BACT|nr:plasmid mobilization relaxosome protein MobC [Hymenobacter setariae]TVT36775.1 plasmid mobilization relaxosome protein MobC [Hymenobacter setariae]
MNEEATPEPTETNRDEVLRFRVTANEKRAIEAKSKAAGFKKTSDYLRTIGIGGEVKEAIPAELRRQLVGIGTNLNQIARRIQSSTLYATDEKSLHQLVATIRQYLV